MGSCNGVLHGLVGSLLPLFVRMLAADYQRWGWGWWCVGGGVGRGGGAGLGVGGCFRRSKWRLAGSAAPCCRYSLSPLPCHLCCAILTSANYPCRPFPRCRLPLCGHAGGLWTRPTARTGPPAASPSPCEEGQGSSAAGAAARRQGRRRRARAVLGTTDTHCRQADGYMVHACVPRPLEAPAVAGATFQEVPGGRQAAAGGGGARCAAAGAAAET